MDCVSGDVQLKKGNVLAILGNPGLQRGWEGKGREGKGRERLGVEKKGEGRGRERGKGKPWEASLQGSFLNRRANAISEV